MPVPGWYAGNTLRDYPFLTRTGTVPFLPSSTIVDFGAILHPDAEFRVNHDHVYLHRIARTGDSFEFEFRTTASGVEPNDSLIFHRSLGQTFVTEWQESSLKSPPVPNTGFTVYPVTGTVNTRWYGDTYAGTLSIASDDNQVRGLFDLTGYSWGGGALSGTLLIPVHGEIAIAGRVSCTSPQRSGESTQMDCQVEAVGLTFTGASPTVMHDLVGTFLNLSINHYNQVSGNIRVGLLGNPDLAVPVPTEPAWQGFLVTGILDELADTLTDGQTITYTPNDWVVEPGCLQPLSYVRRLFIANKERPLSQVPPECDPPVFSPRQCRLVRALSGTPVQLVEGFNCHIRVDEDQQVIQIGGRVGGGAGRPTKALPRYPGEQPPAGSVYYEGGPKCQDMLTAINGVSARDVKLVAGPGIRIENDYSGHRIIIRPKPEALPVCPDVTTPVPLPPPPPPDPTTTPVPTTTPRPPLIRDIVYPTWAPPPSPPSTTTRGPRTPPTAGTTASPGETTVSGTTTTTTPAPLSTTTAPPDIPCGGNATWYITRDNTLDLCRNARCDDPVCPCTLQLIDITCTGYCPSVQNPRCKPVLPENWQQYEPGQHIVGPCACGPW